MLIGCGTHDADETKLAAPKKRKVDSTLILGAYLGFQLKGISQGPMKRFIYDSVSTWRIDEKDTSQANKIWGIDTAYLGELLIPVTDSLTAKALGINDWDGKDTVVRRVDWINKKYVVDYGYLLDSAERYLNKFRDTTTSKNPN